MIACAALVIGFSASTCFHLFNPINQKVTDALRRLDHVGRSVIIYTMTITLVFAAFHSSHEVMRNNIIGVLHSIAFAHMIVQCMPCYTRPENNSIRSHILPFTLILTILGIVAIWALAVATVQEFRQYCPCLLLSALLTATSALIQWTEFPESRFRESRVVHLLFQSHALGHLCFVANAVNLYWLL